MQRSAIEDFLEQYGKSPKTGKLISAKDMDKILLPNVEVAEAIEAAVRKAASHSIQKAAGM